VVTLGAAADSGWVFAGWSGDLTGTANPDSIVMDSNKTVTATFTRQFSLTTVVDGGGSITLDPPGGVYDSLTVVTLSAVADSGWVFAGWSGDVTGIANPDSIVMDSNKTIIATFVKILPLMVNAKMFLEGPYHTGSMDTALKTIGGLPLIQPFNTSPWNYSGGEVVDSLPAAAVDWVLVGLRPSPTAPDIASRAALVKSGGAIADTGGSGGVRFENVPHSDYYVVIYHRNHLPIMSSNALTFTDSSSLYDFTTGQGQAYGSNPMTELDPGVYGMISGDGNADGMVNQADKDDIWRLENGTHWSYSKAGDFNLDGGIDVIDLNHFWRLHNNAVTGVPGITTARTGWGVPVIQVNGSKKKNSGSHKVLNRNKNRSESAEKKPQKNHSKNPSNSKRIKR
jgi:uncharacterized repeat protein (TIGR02543 family)